MIFLKSFDLMSGSQEESFLAHFPRTCFDSYYPLRIFSNEKDLKHLDFSDITIFCGGNGSGKSTLLNIIAEKLKLHRETMFNKTYFFDPYIQNCEYELSVYSPEKLRELMSVSRIIASDDVFHHIIDVRRKNDNLSFKRDVIFEEKSAINAYGGKDRPRNIDFEDPDSYKAFKDYNEKMRKSASRYVRNHVGIEERTYSNGENGFKYFTDAIQPGGLYLLDEPENSLSAEMQLDLVQFLTNMARFYKCQFILSTHSPFILSIPYARIYNMDEEPVKTCKWSELPAVLIYQRFFKEHQSEFE